jgi:RsbRD-like negative regulator of sigma factor
MTEVNGLKPIGNKTPQSIETLASNDGNRTVATESVAEILTRELNSLIQDWLARVEQNPELNYIKLTAEERAGHLPHLLHDVIARLRLEEGTKAPVSRWAKEHGELRKKQGYTVAMTVEESRLLQVTIFSTLHKNVKNLEFGALLPDVVTIADEVDAQLKEQVLRFSIAAELT